jgi:hypothetical protein
MTDLVPAVLILLPPSEQRASSRTQSRASTSPEGERIPVQFNPTSLRVQRPSSQLRSGVLAKNQQVQYPSSEAATLSFDLEFDSAEDVIAGRSGEGPQPVDVRTRSGRISQLTEPATSDRAGAPHRVRFVWGTFVFQGVVTQLTEEFDYFAPNGTPLRSKISLTIQEQNPDHEAKASGPGARTDEGATLPGGAPARPPLPGPGLQSPPGVTPGRRGTDDRQLQVVANQGDSVQQIAARLGGDPSAWRALMNDLDNPLGLSAGVRVTVGPELDTPTTIGRAVGFAAGAGTSALQDVATSLGFLGAVPGDVVAPSVSGSSHPAEAAGFVLTAAGGLAAASRAVLASANAAAISAERSAFAVPARPTAGSGRRVSPSSSGSPFPPVADLDPRALSYGRSLPLRSRVHTETGDEARAGGSRSLTARARPGEIEVSAVQSTAPWERLPPAASGRATADLAQRGRDARTTTMRWKPGGGCR